MQAKQNANSGNRDNQTHLENEFSVANNEESGDEAAQQEIADSDFLLRHVWGLASSLCGR